MRRRNVAVLFRLNQKEAKCLDDKVRLSGLSREAYLRQLISGVVPRNAPPSDYYAMMKELHKIGNNLNQIAQKAHALNAIDVQRYDKEMLKFHEAVRIIIEAVVLPEKAEIERDIEIKGRTALLQAEGIPEEMAEEIVEKREKAVKSSLSEGGDS